MVAGRRFKNVQQRTDDDISDDPAGIARIEMAAASKARREKEDAERRKQNAELKRRLESVVAATDNELDTEEGVAQFAAYLVDFMHGPGAQNDRQYVPKPDEDVSIHALGEGATALYKTAVRARADA